MVKIMEIPIKMDHLGVAQFSETPIHVFFLGGEGYVLFLDGLLNECRFFLGDREALNTFG